MLENSGESFRSEEHFIYGIKNILCPKLLSNCLSSAIRVSSLSLRVFVFLITHYQDHLKKGKIFSIYLCAFRFCSFSI